MAGPQVSSFLAIAKCLALAFGSCAVLVLWRVFTARGREAVSANNVGRIGPNSATLNGQVPQVCVVHHDDDGRILAIEPQDQPEPPEDTTVDLPRAA